MVKPNPMATNAGAALVGMLIGVGQAAAQDLRDRVSNVRDAPLATDIEKKCFCIYFDFDGKTYLGELRERNRDLCIYPFETEHLSNRAIATRVLIDGHATELTGPALASAQLDSLTRKARARMMECSPGGLASVMGGAEIDFMTPDEKALRHQLMLSLPSSAQLALEARERIGKRIASRKGAKVVETSTQGA